MRMLRQQTTVTFVGALIATCPWYRRKQRFTPRPGKARGVNVIGWLAGYFTVSTPRIIMA